MRRTFAEVGTDETFDVVDVGRRLCDEANCRIMEKGVVLYLNNNRLSRGGAIEVADASLRFSRNRTLPSPLEGEGARSGADERET